MTGATVPGEPGASGGRPPLSRAWLFIISIGVCYAAAAAGSFLTSLSVDAWYQGLAKPPFTPPGWAIGAIWTVLYLLMGISLFLVLEAGTGRPDARQGISFFAIQLSLNVIWSLLFFGLRSPLLALVALVLLWGSVAMTLSMFLKVSRPAAYLLVPYLAWVTIAGCLNAGIVLLNP